MNRTTHIEHGYSQQQSIINFYNTLPIDAVGLWHIIPEATNGFNLRGDDLVDYIHRCIIHLVQNGAVPVYGTQALEYDWTYQPQYGTMPDEIATNVINEWLASNDETGWTPGVWFSLPQNAVGGLDRLHA